MKILVVAPDVLRQLELADSASAENEGRDSTLLPILRRALRQVRAIGSSATYRRMIRRGAPYGPHLPEGAPEDGKERGISSFVLCGSRVGQFELTQNVGSNYKNFHELC